MVPARQISAGNIHKNIYNIIKYNITKYISSWCMPFGYDASLLAQSLPRRLHDRQPLSNSRMHM